MTTDLDVEMRVRITQDSPLHPGETATITRLGLGSMDVENGEESVTWVVMVDGVPKEVELPARCLEPLTEAES